MSRGDDFGEHHELPGDDRSATAEDATLHGQPIEDAPGMADAAREAPGLERADPLLESDEPGADPAADEQAEVAPEDEGGVEA